MLLQTSFINTSVLDYEMEILVVEYTKRNKDFQLTFDLQGEQWFTKGEIAFRGDIVPWVLVDIAKDEEKEAIEMSERQIANLIQKATNIRIGLRPIEIEGVDWENLVEMARNDKIIESTAVLSFGDNKIEFDFEPDFDNL